MEESVIYQSLRREALESGIQQVEYSLFRSGITVEQVAGFTGLSLETLEQLQQLLDNEVSDNERPDNEL